MTQLIPPPSPLAAGVAVEWLQRSAPELARDIVMQLDGAAALAKAYGLTPEQWAVVQTTASFKKLVEQAMIEMSGALGTQERIKRKAAMALDQVGILDAASMAGDPKINPAVRLGMLEFLADVAGATGKNQAPGAASGGGGPLIVIHMPGQSPTQIGVVINHPTAEPALRPALEVDP